MLELECELESRGFDGTDMEHTMKTKLTVLTKLTIAGLMQERTMVR